MLLYNQEITGDVKKHIEDTSGGPVVKKLPANAGDIGSIPGLERSHNRRTSKPMHHNY